MEEVLVGLLMGLDVLAVYTFLPKIKRRLALALWTACLHMLFPLIGFFISDIFLLFFQPIAALISIILLFCIGLQLLLSTESPISDKIAPSLLAISVSLDTFSVSVSFGILNLNKQIFLLSAGVSAFICSYAAFFLANKIIRVNRKRLNQLVGVFLIAISIWNFLTI